MRQNKNKIGTKSTHLIEGFTITLGGLNLRDYMVYEQALNRLLWFLTCLISFNLTLYDYAELGVYLLSYSFLTLGVKTLILRKAEKDLRTGWVNDYPQRVLVYKLVGVLTLIPIAVIFYTLRSNEISYLTILILLISLIYYRKRLK